MNVSPEQFERMAKSTLVAYGTMLGPSLHLTMEEGPAPDELTFLLKRQASPSSETYAAAAVVSNAAVDTDGVEPFQRVLDHLIALNEGDALPPIAEDQAPPVVCEYTGEGFRTR